MQSHEPLRGSDNATLNESLVLADRGALFTLEHLLAFSMPTFPWNRTCARQSCKSITYSLENAVPIYQFRLLAISIALRVRSRKLVTNSDPTRA